MRTTVDIESHLLKRLRAEAHRRGVPFKAFLNRVLRRGMEQPHRSEATPYRCPTFAMGAPSHPLDKALALANALEDDEIGRELALRK